MTQPLPTNIDVQMTLFDVAEPVRQSKPGSDDRACFAEQLEHGTSTNSSH